MLDLYFVYNIYLLLKHFYSASVPFSVYRLCTVKSGPVRAGCLIIHTSVLQVLSCCCSVLLGSIHEDHRKKWISSFTLGTLYHTKWRLVSNTVYFTGI